MSKITLADIGSAQSVTSAAATVNANSAAIETAIENTLSRDGTSPNTMGANIDLNSHTLLNIGELSMNSHKIINLAAPVSDNDAARKIDVDNGTEGPEGPQGPAGTNGTNGTNGTDGAAATITAGSATGLPTGNSPTVTNVGTSSAAIFNFGIPAGATGATGAASTVPGPAAWTTLAAWVTSTAYTIGPPASVVSINGNTYVCLISHTSGTFATDLGAGKWGLVAQKGTDGAGTGDFSSNTAVSVDGEVVVFSGTAGKTGKRATGSGIAKLTSGVLGTAVSATDYAPATTGSSILKASSGGFANAVSATDYAPATTGSSILKASSGGFANAVAATDYAPATTGSSILKASSGGFANAVAGTDYVSATTGSAIQKASSGNLTAATAGTDYLAPPSGSAILKANSGGALANATAGTDYLDKGTTSLITVGYTVTPNNLGSITSGTVTPAAASGNYQYYLNNGAHTLATPAADSGIDILVMNGVTPGAITIGSGYRVGASVGDTYATTARTSATVTITNASPGVVSWTSHGFVVGDPVYFTTSGSLPTGLTASTIYYVSTVVNANSFQVSATQGGSAINTSSAGSGTHTGQAPSMWLFSIRRINGISTYVVKGIST